MYNFDAEILYQEHKPGIAVCLPARNSGHKIVYILREKLHEFNKFAV